MMAMTTSRMKKVDCSLVPSWAYLQQQQRCYSRVRSKLLPGTCNERNAAFQSCAMDICLVLF
jgi:hypothetical protein